MMEINTVSLYPTIIPDVIVCWPRNCDYPLWRKFIRLNRTRFNQIFVVFTETYIGDDYRDFVRDAMLPDQVTFLDSPIAKPHEDWRDVAVNWALDRSHASWVWFTEQDFYVLGERFWNEIYIRAGTEKYDLLGIAEGGTRIHPACMFMPRAAIERTSRNFAARPPEFDHFGKIQKDIELLKMNTMILVDEDRWQYKHYNGLSHNWRLASEGQEVNYKPEEFTNYLKMCLDLGLDFEMDMRFINVARRVITAQSREL